MALHLNKIPITQGCFVPIWFELAMWFWRRRWFVKSWQTCGGQTTGDQKSSWAFSSGELNTLVFIGTINGANVLFSNQERTVNHYLIQYFCNSLEMSTIFELWWSFLPGILSSSWNQSLKQENTLFIIMIWCKSSFWTKVNCIHMCNQSIIIYHNTCTLIQKGSVPFIRYWTFWFSIFQVFTATRL